MANTSRNNSLDGAHRAYQACRTGHQSSLSLPSMLRAENPLLSAAVSLYTVRMPMPLHNYRVSIRQVHRCVFASVPSEKKCRIPIFSVTRGDLVFWSILFSKRDFTGYSFLASKSSFSHCSLYGCKSDMTLLDMYCSDIKAI